LGDSQPQHGLVVTFVPKVPLRNLSNINGLFDIRWRNSLRTKRTLLSVTWSTIWGFDGLAFKQNRPKSRHFKDQTAIMMFDLACNASRLLHQTPSAGEGWA
jgi:hypothetical protein